MPAPSAEVVEPAASGSPSISIVPRSAVSAPETILISVDLPAPFSPTIAWTSPARSSRSTPRSAWTPPYRFSTPVSRRTAGSPVAPWARPSGCVVVISLLGLGRAAAARATAAPPAGSVVELVDVVLRDAQGGAEQQRLARRVVAHGRDLGLDRRVGLERGAAGQLLAGPRGQVAQLLDVPEDRGARGAVGQVGLHGLRSAETVGEDLADLARLLDRLGDGRRGGRALAHQAGEVGVRVEQVLGHRDGLRLVLARGDRVDDRD